jgi:hypothetical protein
LADWEGPVGGTTAALLAWSRLLGSARFAMFGETIYKPGWVMRKDWETMASGAVPVIPDTPDKAELGILPWIHFIPLADVQGRDEALRGLAREHVALSLIAERAVAYSRGVMDELALGGFEEMLLGALEGRYRGRVLA